MHTINLLRSEGFATAYMPRREQTEDDHTIRVAEIVKLKKINEIQQYFKIVTNKF
jgi:hypothetical protein